jgi:type IV pilus assembly protein PilA
MKTYTGVTTQMLQRLRHRVQGQEGFTLIELLVVILIIGILAAVAIPAFLNQKGKANDANVKSDVTSAQTAEETYFTGTQAYTAASANLIAIEPTLTQAFLLVTATPAGDSMQLDVPAAGKFGATVGAPSSTNNYDVWVTSKSGVFYALTKNADGTTTRTCSVPSSPVTNPAGCTLTSGTSGNGSW